MRGEDLAGFLESGPAILGASAAADGPPEVFRCWGAVLRDDVLRVFVSPDAELTRQRRRPASWPRRPW